MKTIRHANRAISPRKGTKFFIEMGIKEKREFLVCLLFILLTLHSVRSSAQWTPLTNPALDNNNGQMILLSDGRVLCHTYGGEPNNSCYCGYGKDVYDILTPDATGSYVNGNWSRTDSSNQWRYSFPSVMLKNGKVYLAGGEYGTDGVQAGAHSEIYDPVTNTFTQTGSPGHVISDGNAIILEDGRVLQAQLDFVNTTIIYDPATNAYTAGPNTQNGTNEAMWVKLPDNTVLFVDEPYTFGPRKWNYNIRSSERYFASPGGEGSWALDGNVPTQLWDSIAGETGTAFMLPDGRALYFGSTPTTAYYTPSGNSSAGTWATGPNIPNGNGMPDAPGAMMRDGKILIAVSPQPFRTSPAHPTPTDSTTPTPTYFYVFDYTNNGGDPNGGTFTQINAPEGGLSYNDWSQHNTLLNLPDGNVLYAANGSNQYYIYTPGGQIAAGKPSIVSYSSCSGLMLTGHLFNGISEGSAFNDENENSSNYPIVRLTNGSNVYYARTFNWNSTGVQRGSKLDSVEFTLPSGFPIGPTYSLQVIANGFASDPISVSNFTVYTPPVATANASPNPVCSNATLTLTGGPASMTTYVWSGPGGYNNGSQSPIVSNPVAGTYSLTVTDSHGCTAAASTAPVVVNTPPTVSLQPTDVPAQWGDNISFTSAATGTPAPTIQWQVSTDGGATFNNIGGANSGTLSFSCITLNMSGNKYRAVFTNTCGTAISNAATLTVTKKVVNGVITFNPTTPQYSDPDAITITIPGGFTCGTAAATGAQIYIGTQLMGSITFTPSGTDLTATLNVILLEPTPFGTPPTGQMAPGNHTVTAVLSGMNSNYSIVNPTATLTIAPEDARVAYTGASNYGTITATSTSAVITLSATILDITAVPTDPAWDAYPGDIRNATVTFIDRDNGTIIASNLPVGLVSMANTEIGTATYNWNVTITGTSETFTIGIIVNNYYTRNTSADNTIITVAQPVIGNFETAHANLTLVNSAGLIAGDAGSQNDFSAQVKYNNGKGELQGSVSTTFSRTESDGVHTFDVESGTLNSLFVKPIVANGTATIECNATITDITHKKANVVVDANASLQMSLVDIGGNGSLDSAAITIWDKSGGMWFASNWNGTKTVEQKLSQGNIQVHSNNGQKMDAADEPANAPVNPALTCKVFPVPNDGQFTLALSTGATGVYNMRLTDLAGREIFTESFTAAEGDNNRNYDFTQLPSGLYLMTVRNDTEYQLMKVMVLSK